MFKFTIFYILVIFILSGCGGDDKNTLHNKNSDSIRQVLAVNGYYYTPPFPSKPVFKSGVPYINDVKQWQVSKATAPVFTKLNRTVTDFSDIVYPYHPRLHFRDTDVSYLQSKSDTDIWRSLKEAVESRIPKTMDINSAVEKLNYFEKVWAEYGRDLIFIAFLEKDPAYIKIAKAWGEYLANDSSGTQYEDTLIRRRIERLSEIYDWLYSYLSDAEKKNIRKALKRDIDFVLTFGYMNKTENFIQKHSRWARGVVAQGLLVMYGDFDENFTKEYADKELKVAREKILKYNETERYITQDGGFHLGWMYAASYGGYESNYLIWSTATKETFLDDWMGELSYWFIYGLRGDQSLPDYQDSQSVNMSYGALATLYNAKFKNDGYAKWYLEEMNKNDDSKRERRFFRFLFDDENVVATSPETLPKSRLFRGVGVVIARDRWDEKTTQLIFKASPFYNAGHHHRDENSFVIHYQVPLAVDTGIYDKSDSEHYKNYYTRTIAHNSVTVYNPNQKMYYNVDFNTQAPLSEKLIVNDGGQVYKTEDSMVLDDIVQDGKNYLGGITNYEDKEEYTYVKADESKAYDPLSVSLEQRELVYLRDSAREHPIIIVLDRIEATSGYFQKRYLLHVDSNDNTRPVLRDNMMIVVTSEKRANQNRRAKLTNVTLYPQDATLALVGGEGKEFVVYGDTNFAPLEGASKKQAYEDIHRKVGNWRLEVSPKVGKKYDVMLNILFPDDVSSTAVTARDAKLVDSSNAVGVELKNRVFVFPKSKELFSEVSYKVSQTGTLIHTIATGLPRGTLVSCTVGSKYSTAVVGNGGCVDFEIESNNSTSIKITKI